MGSGSSPGSDGPSVDGVAAGAGVSLVVLTFLTAYTLQMPFELMYGIPGVVAGGSLVAIHLVDEDRDGDGVVADAVAAGAVGTVLGLVVTMLVSYVAYVFPTGPSLVEWLSSVVMDFLGRGGLSAGANVAVAGGVGWLLSRVGGPGHGDPVSTPDEPAVQRLKEQYANGSISEEEFERALERILGSGRDNQGEDGAEARRPPRGRQERREREPPERE